MFSSLKIKDLKKLISVYRQHHNIKGYSKMKKQQLVDELDKRFIIQDNQLYFKTQQIEKQPETPKQKKRITPQIVGSQQPQEAFRMIPTTNAVRRTLKKANELEEYYKRRGDADEYPDLAF